MNNCDEIFSIKTDSDFLSACINVFQFQAEYCKPYADWLRLLNIDIKSVREIEQIPFLPIELFKTKRIYCGNKKEEIVFSSSSTTGKGQSFHYVADVGIYEKSFTESFRLFYGNPSKYAILGLLPSYLEREGSSLIYMVDSLIKQSKQPQSGFFLHNLDELYNTLCTLKDKKTPTILIGVTYALLDFAERFQINFPDLIVMETGGMKGKRKEISKEELHAILRRTFGVQHIHSEYGMAELLSQAYSRESCKFICPPWMRIVIRDVYDPLKILPANKTGGINVIDLANINSCAFIATQDLGKTYADGAFEILGRFTASDIRGCNLLVQ